MKKLLLATFLFVSFWGGAQAEDAVLNGFSRDAVEICVSDLKGGDSKALLLKRGFALEGREKARQLVYVKDFPAHNHAGKPIVVNTSIFITRKNVRKRLSVCRVVVSLAQNTGNILYQNMQKHVARLGYRPTLERNGIVFDQDGFSFGLKGSVVQYGISIHFIRY